MTLLIGVSDLAARRAALAGPLAPLAASLRADLARLIEAPEVWYPAEKACLTRIGGRCPSHGVLLDFDPSSPRAHLCLVCGTTLHDEEHYRWWIMNYQLWLAERAVHSAALAALTGDQDCRALASRILEGYADRYLSYPNRDNVLGPARVFFSTYLESIWLLQIAVAVSLLELETGPGPQGQRLRERVIEPAAELIAQYHEGDSNRQVWNSVALAGAQRLLGREAGFERTLMGSDGLHGLLERGLLPDGTWYEGENYHLFAHRGLWYGLRMADVAGLGSRPDLYSRFVEGFRTPFLTALPDLTFPSRRDSQYRVSLRQWRAAESCELGLAEAAGADDRLSGVLQALYRPDLPWGNTGRAASTAEAERNVAPSRLSRSSLGWKSLLRAVPHLPEAAPWLPGSVHLPSQGFSVFRRDGGRCYVALDYGASGGGHGHPDRLNTWFVHDDCRWLEDVGTGSYVDRTLFWYRSTLAHNAPIADGASQPARDAKLLARDEKEDVEAGWVVAEFALSPGRVIARRRLVMMKDYFIDQLEWSGADDVTIDLPIHVDPHETAAHHWRVVPRGFEARPGSGAEFVSQAERLDGPLTHAQVSRGARTARVWAEGPPSHEWWRLRAPGPPAYVAASEPPASERRFLLFRARGAAGTLTQVWSWNAAVTDVRFGGNIVVTTSGGEQHTHGPSGALWRISGLPGGDLELDGRVDEGSSGESAARSRRSPDPDSADRVVRLVGGASFVLEMGEEHYRRSEEPWARAGAPTASLLVSTAPAGVRVTVDVRKHGLVFAPARAENRLDNEHPDINSDGLQFYLAVPGRRFFGSWIMVPEIPGPAMRVTPRAGGAATLPLAATWERTSEGYRMHVVLDRMQLFHPPAGGEGAGGGTFYMNVVVNEISAERDRRRGQLVATGARGEWTYLRGDREDPDRMLAFQVTPAHD